MTTHEFNNSSDQAERKQVVKNDCYFNRAIADADMIGGRFKKVTETIVTGGTPQYPTPPNGPWSTPDVSGAEPPLGYEIDALPALGGESTFPVTPFSVETATPPMTADALPPMGRDRGPPAAPARSFRRV
jgi:hypothetical protein